MRYKRDVRVWVETRTIQHFVSHRAVRTFGSFDQFVLAIAQIHALGVFYLLAGKSLYWEKEEGVRDSFLLLPVVSDYPVVLAYRYEAWKWMEEACALRCCSLEEGFSSAIATWWRGTLSTSYPLKFVEWNREEGFVRTKLLLHTARHIPEDFEPVEESPDTT